MIDTFGTNKKRIRSLLLRNRANLHLAFDWLISLLPLGVRRDWVLIVRLDAIGDFVLWLGAARVIAQAYKSTGTRVILVADPTWADWAKELNIFDQVIAVNPRTYRRNIRYHVAQAIRIRRLACRMAIEPTYSRTDVPGDSIIRTCGATDRIGFGRDASNSARRERRMSDRWYTRLISASPAPLTELKRNTEFVNGLLGTDHATLLPDLRSYGLPGPSQEFWDGIDDSIPYYILAPGAMWGGKRWPTASFRRIAERLYAETGWQGIVCGGPTDIDLASDLCSGADISLINYAGRTSLAQLAAIISRASLVMANDTSAIHIAAAAGVPSICVLGGGHFGRFLPYSIEQQELVTAPKVVIHKMKCFNCDWNCIYDVPKESPFPCITGVTVEDVWRVVQSALARDAALNLTTT